MRDARGKTRAAVAVIRDISERKQAQATLENANLLLETRVGERTSELVAAIEELEDEITLRKKLEGELLEVSDREQRRLGQDLHDSLCQHLAATAFMTRALAERVKSAKTIKPEEIEKIAGLINEGVTEARMVARGLHPVEMDSAGLPVALRSLSKLALNVSCRAEIDDELPFIDHSVATHLYRIAREAVINANKHARARAITLRMKTLKRWIELSVTDDGVGVSRRAESGSGMGFHIMNYRARAINARLKIKHLKTGGTRVVCHLPRK
jgi:signal transduction histidine kinase